MPHWLKYLLKLILLASAYYGSGRLGLLLTIPPGQATAIWPASGIALAGLLLFGIRYAPAVTLGAIGTSLYHPEVIDTKALLIASTIGIGAGLQAILGCILVRRTCKAPFLLEELREVVCLLLYGGILSCIVNATIGSLTLYLAGFVSLEGFLLHWVTWWAGDIIGVVVFTPTLLFVLSGEGAVYCRRKIIVSSTLCITFLLVVYLFFLVKEQEMRGRMLVFHEKANDIQHQFQKSLQAYLDVLIANERFVISTEAVDQSAFEKFNEVFLQKYIGIQSLSWNPQVLQSERETFENGIRAVGFPDFNILDRNVSGGWEVAASRERYFPVAYAASLDRNYVAHGFDIYGNDVIGYNDNISILDRARDSGMVIGSGRITIMQARDAYGLQLFMPVYDSRARPGTVTDRRQALIGYVAGVFVFPKMLEESVRLARWSNMDIVLWDLGSSPNKQLLYDSRTPNHKEAKKPLVTASHLIEEKSHFGFAGTQWEIAFIENGIGLIGKQNWMVWTVLVGGLLYVGLVGAFLLVVTARTAIVERIVDEKTMILKEQKADLEKINRELDSFVHTVSHDLRAPLRGISSFASFLDEDYKNVLDDQGKEYIDRIVRGTQKLEKLTVDLLALSHISRIKNPYEDTAVSELIHSIVEQVEFDIMEQKVDLRVQDDLPIIRCDKIKLKEVFLNLITNAIKFSSKNEGESPKVYIGYRDVKAYHEFHVKDNGIGIAQEYYEKVFEVFQRLPEAIDFEGTGAGLSIVKRIIEDHRGKIWIESKLGKGTTVYFTIPKDLQVDRNLDKD